MRFEAKIDLNLCFQRSLSNTEDECTHLREMCETSQKELQDLAEKHQEQLQEIGNLQDQLQVRSGSGQNNNSFM